jgi:hypothetical protein
MNLTKTGIVLATFVVGCGAGAFASQLAIPSARAGTSPTRWEYLWIRSPDNDEMNKAGAEGWELATVSGALYCLKRPLP